MALLKFKYSREKENSMNSQDNSKIAMRVSVISIVVNLLLSIFKLLAGIIAHSGAMISDAVHSASDVFSTIIVIIGVRISEKPSDDDHPYGHERFECVASILLAIFLAATGLGIGKTGLDNITSGNYAGLAVPGILALVAAVSSIIIKEAMYWYTRGAAKKINSGALMADAWHHRSDALSSIGAFVGILGARLGFPISDSIASLIICLFILKAAYDIFMDAVDKTVDKACPEEVVSEMRDTILACENVRGIDLLRTRLFGSRMYVEVEIILDGELRLVDAHDIAEQVHDAIEEHFKDVKHCTVHVNPEE